ncbi:MAG: DUF3784 domain-containing protein [Clostridiales bacterium]|nr:DUF3784 domain-containing protein [Clostridiales bacterium]
MNYMCIFLGIIFITAGIAFALGKVHKHLFAWKVMPDNEKEGIKIEALCRNIGEMIILSGIIFILSGLCAGFSEAMFTVVMIVWMIIACFDVYYISKSSRYKR